MSPFFPRTSSVLSSDPKRWWLWTCDTHSCTEGDVCPVASCFGKALIRKCSLVSCSKQTQRQRLMSLVHRRWSLPNLGSPLCNYPISSSGMIWDGCLKALAVCAEWLTDESPIRVKEEGKAKGCGACLPFLWLIKACLSATELCDTAQPTIFITAQSKHWAWSFTCSYSLRAIGYPQEMVLGQGESRQSCASQNTMVSLGGKRVISPFWGGTTVSHIYCKWNLIFMIHCDFLI